jgi:hypothetical protein
MEKSLMLKWVKEIIRKTKFESPKIIYQAFSGDDENLRNIIYQGSYRGKSCVLKIYHEPRRIAETASITYFNKVNQSKTLIAPKVYRCSQTSPWQGWYIMEKLPKDGYFLSEPDYLEPISQKTRKEFLQVYLEYKKNFPLKPWRPLLIAEKLPADEFHIIRIHRWFEMANEKEIELELKGGKPFLNTERFFPLYFKAQEFIKKEFRNRKMFWSHGHFKPKEIFYSPQRRIYYLTDFAHNYLYPEGYELGFMVWSDWLMGSNWKMNYKNWYKGIDLWVKDILPVAKKLRIKNPGRLINASLVERTLGAILADVTASSRPNEEKKARLNLLTKLLENLLK